MALRRVPAALQDRLLGGKAAEKRLAEPAGPIVTARGRNQVKVDQRGRPSQPGSIGPGVVVPQIETETQVPTPDRPPEIPPPAPVQPEPEPVPEPEPEPEPEPTPEPEPEPEAPEAEQLPYGDDALTAPDYEAMTKAQLVAAAEERGVDSSGTKATLIKRLKEG